jgi:uncharacterized protein YerC
MEKLTKIVGAKTGLTVYLVPTKEEKLTWEVIDATSVIELTHKERLTAEAKSYDLEKFLKVKQLLTQGYSYSKVKELTGIAKTTTSRYRKDFCKSSKQMILETNKKPT